jgi:cytochrome c-type protein NapB
MKTRNLRGVLAVLVAVLFILGAAGTVALADEGRDDEGRDEEELDEEEMEEEELDEDELGIRKRSLFSEDQVKPAHGEYSTAQPGASKRFRRAFENSPPLIPHDLTGLLPIMETNNSCVGCHMPKPARSIGAVPTPKSHLMDMNTGKDLGGELDGARYNCMQCHVPQVRIPEAVENMFTEEFRDKKSEYNSNLADILNEGVEAE